jgi:NitT/TauT family transport system permease protein
MKLNRLVDIGAPLAVLIVFVVLWQAVCVGFHVPQIVVPTPISVAEVLYNMFGAIWFHASHTLVTTLCGFALAVVVGLGVGMVIGTSRLAYKAFYPLMIGFNSIPKVALVSVFVIWFGNGVWPAVLTAFITSFFPVAVNVTTGLATLEPELEDVMRSLGARRIDIIRKVALPRTMPYFFASLKVAITLAFVGSVIAETMASNRGIGVLMVEATSNFRIPLVFAGLVFIAAMGIVMYVIFALIERQVTGWATRGHTG